MTSPAVLVVLLVTLLAEFSASFEAVDRVANKAGGLGYSSRIGPGVHGLDRSQHGLHTGDEVAGLSIGRALKKNGTKEPKPTLVSGMAAACGRFPYMVSLRDHHDEHKCGGVLVGLRWVATAAHCVDPKNPRSAGATPIAVIGSCNLDDKNNENGVVETFLAEDIFLHDKWTGDVADEYDLALVELAGVSEHPAVGLPTRRDVLHKNQRFVALGWGVRGDGAEVKDLQETGEVDVVDSEDCESEVLWERELGDDVLCAFGFMGDEICEGDSGGPLVRLFAPGGNITAGKPSLDVVVGIASFRQETAECGDSKLPSVFTKLAGFRRWIDGIMEGTGQTSGLNDPNPPPDGPALSTSSAASAPLSAPSLSSALFPQEAPLLPSPPVGKVRLSQRGSQRELNQALFEAATHGDLGGVQRAWRKGASLTATHGEFGETPLHVAAHNGHADVVDFLLSSGAPVDDLKSSGTTPLFVAAQNGHMDVVVLLLASRAATDRARPADGVTPLFIASQNGHAQVVAQLLAVGADPNKLDVIGEAPLHIAPATLDGSVEIVTALISAGAEVNARGVAGLTPLLWAAYYGNLGVAEALVEAGADKEAVSDGGEGGLDLICRCEDNRDVPSFIQCPGGGCDAPEAVAGLEALWR